MQRRLFLIKVGITLLSCTSFSFVHASNDTALDFVKSQRLGSNLQSIAIAVAMRTVTYAGLVKRIGDAQARAWLAKEIDRLLPSYQDQWDKNLADSYALHFSTAELASLARDGQKSAYASKLSSKNSEVGSVMQKKSEPLLTALVTEALSNSLR